MRLRAATILLCALLVPATVRADGFTESLELATRAYDVPRGAPTLVAHAPSTFDPTRPFDVVLFLHGWNGCVNVLVRAGDVACRAGEDRETGWDLAGAFDGAGTNALLLAPQLAYRAREGKPGRLAREGATRAMIDEALVALGPKVANRRVAGITRVIVVAHSAGFMSALAVMRRGGLGDALERVVLMDALYDVPGAFFGWLREHPHRALVSIHTADRRTTMHNRTLEALGRGAFSADVATDPRDLRDAVATRRLVIARTSVGHSLVPRRHFGEVLDPSRR